MLKCKKLEFENDMTVTQVEKILDKNIKCYNKFNKKHPMKGVAWINSTKKYKIQCVNVKTHAKKLNSACNKVINQTQNDITKIDQNTIHRKKYIGHQCAKLNMCMTKKFIMTFNIYYFG